MDNFIFLNRLIPSFLKPESFKSLDEVFTRTKSRNKVYEEMEKFYRFNLPLKFIKHRKYFSKNRRGFGEDAFHSMWFLLFSQYRPINCLEIGVYRGQTITLWNMLSKWIGYETRIACISPFSSAGDTVSQYSKDLDYLTDLKENHDYFKIKYPEICIDLSTGKKAKEFISSRKWDLIYIDGSHDYEVVSEDWDISVKNLSERGLIVMDDSSLYFDYIPKDGSFAGHPGPSKVAKEISVGQFKLIGGVGHNNIFSKNI